MYSSKSLTLIFSASCPASYRHSYISLYEWLMVHEVSVEDVRYYGAEETTETREKFQEDEQVMLVHTRNGYYDFYPLCDLYFE